MVELSLLIYEHSAGVRSTRSPWQRAKDSERLVKTPAICFFILIALVLSSAFALNLIQDARNPLDDQDPDHSQNPGGLPGYPSEGDSRWNWEGMADSSGRVGVIFVLPSDVTARDPLEYLASALSSLEGDGSASHQQLLMDEIRDGGAKRYSSAISGFSARMSVSSAKALCSMELSIQIYPDVTVRALASDNIIQVGADQMWSRVDSKGQSVTGKGVVVAVLDSGVDYTHPDLGSGIGSNYKVIGGYDFHNNDSDPMDDNGHGTHVAGIVAANGPSFSGVAPGARILAYKVLGSDGNGLESSVIEAIDRALDPNGDGDTSDHADVITMSLGSDGKDGDPLCVAVKNAYDAGAVVVAAAGNDGPAMGTVSSPGLAPEAITVGAVDSTGSLAQFSSRGTGTALQIKPDICAPGVSILSTVPFSGTRYSSSTGYYTLSGTSMATPHVTGAAALLLQLHPDWTPSMVKSSLLTESAEIAESIWVAGSGQLWIPSSADASLFSSSPLVSCSHVAGFSHGLTVKNSGASSTFSLAVHDWSSLGINGSAAVSQSIDACKLSVSSITISSGGSGSFALDITMPQPSAPEGYFDGELLVSDGPRNLKIQYGYAILSVLNVHVIDVKGNEVFDSDGGVWAYRIPDVGVSVSASAPSKPAPPASFVLESGTYSVHSAGHQELYFNSDPYALSSVVQLDRTQTVDVYLLMSSAHKMTLKLETSEGCPIYVDHYWLYFRYVGLKNVSFHLFSIDDTITGDDMSTLPKSRAIYVSDTGARVGIAITGYAYSATMYDFMNSNWRHWYEVANSMSADFRIEASADLEYLLSWEFDGVNPSSPTTLALEDGKYSVVNTKYDLPGTADMATNTGSHLSMGTASNQYLRRDTGTSIPPIFSGLTRKIFVQGVFEEFYTPGYLRGTAFDQEFFVPDYDHLVDYSYDVNEIFLPDRNFLKPLAAVTETSRVGQGPFYPSVRTMNTNETLAIMHPVLRDQSGAKVVGRGIAEPDMQLYRYDSPIGMYHLSEFQRTLDAMRFVDLPGAGTYRAEIVFKPCCQICDYTSTVLGFSVPSVDTNPPEITGLSMPMRFASGDTLDLRIEARDNVLVSNVDVSWRPDSASSWRGLVVSSQTGDVFASQIKTISSDKAVHLKVKVSDSSGNYIEYTASNASLVQIPVLFDLEIDRSEFEYRNRDTSTTITGRLTDLNGRPISANDSIPLEFYAGDRKLAMILDEYVTSTSHRHDGNIQFEWHFNPGVVFSGPDQTLNVQVTFDLGIYQPVSEAFSIRSIASSNTPPVITLVSPANGSLMASGQVIDLSISDDGIFTANANLDGTPLANFFSPWEISTSSWSDGRHVLDVTATDDQFGVARASYEFEVDAVAPSVTIGFPAEGARVPANSALTADIYDSRLSSVVYSKDNGPAIQMPAPYEINMTGWSPGVHVVAITATDVVGHSTSRQVSFEISDGSIALQLVSPANNSFVRSGVSIQLAAIGEGSMTYRWCEEGVWTDIGTQTTIPVIGWQQGCHTLLLNVTSSLGGWDQIVLVITVDDVSPQIQLQSPADGSFVSPAEEIVLHVEESNLEVVTWTLQGASGSSYSSDVSIPLTSLSSDGTFTVTILVADKSGNQMSAEFTFKLDSSPPALSLADLSSGEVAKLGSVLHVAVGDAYLALVEWSLDDGAQTELAAPYVIDTAPFSVGWHSLSVVAIDSSGKQAVIAVSFYLDNESPAIGSLSSTEFVYGSDFILRTSITDDYGVGQALLYYELEDGSFASSPMVFDQGSYMSVIPEDSLWDGMAVYVSCMDVAGNDALSPHVQLSGKASQRGLNLGFLSSLSGIAFMVVVAMISSISMLYVSKRRDKDDERAPEQEAHEPAPQPVDRQEHVPMPSPAPAAPRPERPSPRVRTARMERKLAEPKPARDPMDELIEMFLKEPPTLLDSIPKIVIKDEDEEGHKKPSSDYGDMIEKELIIPGLKNSVYKEDVHDFSVEIDLQLAELQAMIKDRPKKPIE